MEEGGGKIQPPPRKIMVIADPTQESADALEYTLSHVIMEQDELILVHVQHHNAWKNPFSTFLRRRSLSSTSTAAEFPDARGLADVDFLEEMRKVCERSQPKTCVRVEKLKMEASNKAAAVLSHSEMIGADLIVIGQRRSLSNALLRYRKAGGGSLRGAKALDTAEYLIENSECTCVGVHKKGQNAGYVLNTKTHRNFWLLA